MKAIPILFRDGHLYKKETGQRITLKEAGEYILIAEHEDDATLVTFSRPTTLRTTEEIRFSLINDPGVSHCKKIADSGTPLYYSLNRKAATTEPIWFRVTLLEDLYLYSKKTFKDVIERERGKVNNCACMIDQAIDTDPGKFEPIYAKSLNEAIKLTFIHYFGNDGTPGRNAYSDIHFSPFKKAAALEILRGFADEDLVLR